MVTRISTEMDVAFVRCRSYGHAWDEFAPIDLEPPLFGWRLSLRCLRCTSERLDNLDYHGRKIGRRYRYAEGYLMPKGAGQPREVFVEALFDRLRADLEKLNALGAEPPAPEPVRRSRKKVAVSA